MDMPQPSQEAGTVLIVDDDPLHLQLYSWILERRGHKCLIAQVRSNSVDLPENVEIDVALLDYKLNSSLTAIDVFHQIKARFAKVPIVILSDRQWMPDDLRGHANAFVSKGDPKMLLDTIGSILWGHPDGPGKAGKS